MAEGRFEIHPVGPYSFEASVRFLEGFVPASYGGLGWTISASRSSPMGAKRSPGSTCTRRVAASLARCLERRRPGWAIIGQRVRIGQAAGIKAQMARELGPSVEVRGEEEHAFPAPSRVARLERFPGLTGRKVEYLGRLAEEAAAGKLDAAYLRSLPVDEALERLKELPGIGDFSAELILLRGAGEPDYLPVHEPRLGRAAAVAYGLEAPPTKRELEETAERWRPYRTWVSLHLRTMLEDETHEIAGDARR